MGQKTCGRCGGGGTVTEPTNDPNRVNIITCPNCGGSDSEYQWEPPKKGR